MLLRGHPHIPAAPLSRECSDLQQRPRARERGIGLPRCTVRAERLTGIETPPGVLRPALEPSAQQRHGPVGVGPEEGLKNDQQGVWN